MLLLLFEFGTVVFFFSLLYDGPSSLLSFCALPGSSLKVTQTFLSVKYTENISRTIPLVPFLQVYMPSCFTFSK